MTHPEAHVSKSLCIDKMMTRNPADTRVALMSARVAVAGAGGLGSNIAAMLARAGVGELLIVDHDVVEQSNLNRQHYGVPHIGMKKIDAMKKQLEDINPFVCVKTVDAYITADNAVSIFNDYDIVCEAFDDPTSKAALVSALLANCPNIKIVAASGMAGIGSANNIRTRAVMNGRLCICGDESSTMADGLMSPRVTVCAGHQANAVIRLLLGIDEV